MLPVHDDLNPFLSPLYGHVLHIDQPLGKEIVGFLWFVDVGQKYFHLVLGLSICSTQSSKDLPGGVRQKLLESY